MPHLGSLLICEKVIIDQQQKPSLISVFQSLSALIPDGKEIPKDTVSFTQWAIFTEWFFSDDETKRQIDQVVEVLLPDGSPSSIGGRVTFQQFSKDGQGTRVYVNLFGMPISQPGSVTVNVWLESEYKKITDVSHYQIKIEHTSKPPVPNDGGALTPALSPVKPS